MKIVKEKGVKSVATYPETVRADRAYRAGEMVGFLAGAPVGKTEYESLAMENQLEYIQLDAELFSPARLILSGIGPARSGYLPHRCYSNLGFADSARLIATRDIAPGQEFNLDRAYGQTSLAARFCSCGSPRCRAQIGGRDWQSPVVLAGAGAWQSPWVREQSGAGPFAASGAWGYLTSVDLYDCDPARIRDKATIEKYVVDLCDLIEMKRFGDPVVVHFGEEERVAGYSMFQLIETSCVSGHFANASNAAYLDIFSCKLYDPGRAEKFSREFFGAGRSARTCVNRW